MGKRLTDIAVERLNKKTKGYVVWDAAQIGLHQLVSRLIIQSNLGLIDTDYWRRCLNSGMTKFNYVWMKFRYE